MTQTNKINFIEHGTNDKAGWYLTIGGKDFEDLPKLREYIKLYKFKNEKNKTNSWRNKKEHN